MVQVTLRQATPRATQINASRRRALPILRWVNAWRHRVVPAPVPRMTPQQAAQRQVTPATQAETLDSLDRVPTTGRGESARGRAKWTDRLTIELDDGNHSSSKEIHERARTGPDTEPALAADSDASRRSAASKSRPSAAEVATEVPGNARITVDEHAGTSSRRSASRARSRRLTRCRTTLPPTALATTRPNEGKAPVLDWLDWPTSWWTTRFPRRTRVPRRTTDVKSADRRIRFGAGNT